MKTGVKLGDREKKPGGGRIGNLESDAEKLFFTLFYSKCYPTFDILGFVFDLNRSNANRNIHKLMRTLEKAPGTETTLPKRKIRTMEELFAIFPDVRDLFIGGTERLIQIPKDNEKQKENHSGKKRRIDYLSPTMEGKKHDYRMFKDEFPPPYGIFTRSVVSWMDLGFIGVEKDYTDAVVIMSKKKPKGIELTDDAKAWNRIVSGFRVLVEHAIGGVKRFRIVYDKFRNKKKEFDDNVILISCGLWNCHLKRC